MAGKSNKGKHRRVSHAAANSAEGPPSSDAAAAAKEIASPSDSIVADANGVPAVGELGGAGPELKESETADPASQSKQGTHCFANVFHVPALSYEDAERTYLCGYAQQLTVNL